ncbi:MAG: hypothetical protein AAB869_00970 [Patescibacteria group bacterium]
MTGSVYHERKLFSNHSLCVVETVAVITIAMQHLPGTNLSVESLGIAGEKVGFDVSSGNSHVLYYSELRNSRKGVS